MRFTDEQISYALRQVEDGTVGDHKKSLRPARKRELLEWTQTVYAASLSRACRLVPTSPVRSCCGIGCARWCRPGPATPIDARDAITL
jgi:hypothetical protein